MLYSMWRLMKKGLIFILILMVWSHRGDIINGMKGLWVKNNVDHGIDIVYDTASGQIVKTVKIDDLDRLYNFETEVENAAYSVPDLVTINRYVDNGMNRTIGYIVDKLHLRSLNQSLKAYRIGKREDSITIKAINIPIRAIDFMEYVSTIYYRSDGTAYEVH